MFIVMDEREAGIWNRDAEIHDIISMRSEARQLMQVAEYVHSINTIQCHVIYFSWSGVFWSGRGTHHIWLHAPHLLCYVYKVSQHCYFKFVLV